MQKISPLTKGKIMLFSRRKLLISGLFGSISSLFFGKQVKADKTENPDNLPIVITTHRLRGHHAQKNLSLLTKGKHIRDIFEDIKEEESCELWGDKAYKKNTKIWLPYGFAIFYDYKYIYGEMVLEEHRFANGENKMKFYWFNLNEKTCIATKEEYDEFLDG